MTNPRIINRKLHRWGAVLVAVPFLVVILSGILLQLKKQLPFVQPAEKRGTVGATTLGLEQILATARTVPQARIAGWEDIDRIDVRPAKGMLKVVGVSRWELQLDIASGEVLQVAYRRSDLIESLHDGSFFSQFAKLAVFLPTAFIVLALWITGIYLWLLPYRARRARARGTHL